MFIIFSKEAMQTGEKIQESEEKHRDCFSNG